MFGWLVWASHEEIVERPFRALVFTMSSPCKYTSLALSRTGFYQGSWIEHRRYNVPTAADIDGEALGDFLHGVSFIFSFAVAGRGIGS